MPEAKKRYHIIVKGRVQGVFFRKYTRDTAVQLGLLGYVRNLPNGDVEAVAEGESWKLAEFIAFCKKGSPASHVDEVEIVEEPLTGEFKDFSVRY